MYRRITVVMPVEERTALETLAARDLRHPRQYIRYLIRKAATAAGLMSTEEELTLKRKDDANERPGI